MKQGLDIATNSVKARISSSTSVAMDTSFFGFLGVKVRVCVENMFSPGAPALDEK